MGPISPKAFRLFIAFLTLCLHAISVRARAEDAADALLKKMATATNAAKTLSADMTLTQSNGGPETKTTGKIKLKKPNFARIELDAPFNQTTVADGRSLWLVEHGRKRYQKNDAKPDGNQVASFTMIPVGIFFDTQFRGFTDASITTTRLLGTEIVDGVNFRVVEVTGDKPYQFTLKCFIAPNDLVTRTTMQMKVGEQAISFGAVLSNLKVNEPLPDGDFRYAPPKDFVLLDHSDPNGKLLPIGQAAFRFSVVDPTGVRLTLDNVLKEKKAVLVNFWFIGCEPCRKEFPALQSLYDELKSKGLALIALNVNDSPAAVASWIARQKFTFAVGMCKDDDRVIGEFHVAGYPTNYLLDSEGKVIWRSTGFNEAELRAALKKLGIP